MKRGREDEKVVRPLFPRLHVNDADKGGPRAPPRNKMALYEQLSIPSQRLNSGTLPSLTLPRHQARNLVSSTSSSQGIGHNKSTLSPFNLPSFVATDVTERVLSQPKECQHAVRPGFEKKSQKYVSQGMINTEGNEQAVSHGSSIKESSGRLEGVDDFRVPTFVQHGSVQHLWKNHHMMKRETRAHVHSDCQKKSEKNSLESPMHIWSLDDKPLEQQIAHVSPSRQHERCSTEAKIRRVTKNVKSANYMSCSSCKEKSTKPFNMSKSLSLQKCQCRKSTEVEPSHCGTVALCQEDICSLMGIRHIKDTEVMGERDKRNANVGSYSRIRSGENLSFMAKNCNTSCKDNVPVIGEVINKNDVSRIAEKAALPGDTGRDHPLRDVDRNDDSSETSIVDSESGASISPDDVVGVIGPKHFWKARRAIINQQRVFALQVFELHRLIEVQKHIAASPHLLLEEHLCLRETPPTSPVKASAAKFIVEPQHHKDQEEDNSCKVNRSGECPEPNAGSASHLHHEDKSDMVPKDLLRRNRIYSENAYPAVLPPDKSPASWPLPLPGNQWLIPVMSPIEGLIYKPYSGHCPPNGAFTAPVYGGCGVVPPGAGDFINLAYGIPNSHKQQNGCVLPNVPAVTPCFFPTPFGLPVSNPVASSSVVEQVSSLARPWHSDQKEQQTWNSCNMSSLRNEELPERTRKLKTRGSDLQGSTASSPGERAQPCNNSGSAFPVSTSSGQPSDSLCRDHQSRIIKVVPHNPRTASESAARIFRAIQEERQQHDSF